MKKNISIAFAAMLFGLAISCQKEELVSDKTDAVQYTLNINVNDQAGFDNDATTKGGSSESRKTAWESGDRIFLFFKPFDGDNLLYNRIMAASLDFAKDKFNIDTINGQLGKLYEELGK